MLYYSITRRDFMYSTHDFHSFFSPTPSLPAPQEAELFLPKTITNSVAKIVNKIASN